MPQLNKEVGSRHPKPVEIPPKVLENLLKRDPENFDRVLSTLAGFAIEEGSRVMRDLNKVHAKLPDKSHHKEKVEKLKTDTLKAEQELKIELKNQEVNPSPEPEKETKSAWTPEMVKNLQAKLEARKLKEEKEKKVTKAKERGHELAELMQAKLIPIESDLKALEKKVKTTNLTRDQKDDIKNLTKQLDQQLAGMKLTDKEKREIMSQLPSYKNLKIANLRDDIETIDKNITRMKKVDKADQVIRGFYKRIPKLLKDKERMKKELRDLAA